MKFWEAMKELQEGKKVKKVKWYGSYIYYDRESKQFIDSSGETYDITYLDESEEWELYEDNRKSINSNALKKIYKAFKEFAEEDWNECQEFLDFYCDTVGNRDLEFGDFLDKVNKYYKLDE